MPQSLDTDNESYLLHFYDRDHLLHKQHDTIDNARKVCVSSRRVALIMRGSKNIGRVEPNGLVDWFEIADAIKAREAACRACDVAEAAVEEASKALRIALDARAIVVGRLIDAENNEQALRSRKAS